STEWKYLVLSPEKDPLGLMLYIEPGYNGPELELEAKLILQKNIGESLVAALNLMVENEYAYEAASQVIEGFGEGTLGLAWKATPGYAIGLELRNHREYPDNWGWEEHSAWFIGPSLHAAKDKWWATLTVLPQIGGRPETIKGDGRF